MAFQGWVVKFGKTAVPNGYLERYKDTPNQRLEIDAYRDSAALLHRETSPNYKTKIIIPIRKLYLGEKILLKAIVDSGTVSESTAERQRKVSVEYWNSEDMDYKSGIFYIADISYEISHIDEHKLNMTYEPFEITLTEY